MLTLEECTWLIIIYFRKKLFPNCVFFAKLRFEENPLFIFTHISGRMMKYVKRITNAKNVTYINQDIQDISGNEEGNEEKIHVLGVHEEVMQFKCESCEIWMSIPLGKKIILHEIRFFT